LRFVFGWGFGQIVIASQDEIIFLNAGDVFIFGKYPNKETLVRIDYTI